MTTIDATAFVHGWLIVLAVLGLCHAWRSYWTEFIRMALYAVRDDLFDAAVRGEVGFDDPHYQHAREQLHLAIRVAHMVSSVRLLAMLPVVVTPHVGPEEPPGPTPQAVRTAMARQRDLVRVLLLLNAPVALMAAVVVGMVRGLRRRDSVTSLGSVPREALGRAEEAMLAGC